MLEKFLHQETLRSGLNDYLNIHKYGNAETKDLWNVLSKHANQSLDVKVQLVKKFCAFYGMQQFITVSTRAYHWIITR